MTAPLTLLVMIAVVCGTAAAAESHPPVVRGGIPSTLAKLEAGGEVTVGFIGGSITEANGWRPRVLDALRELYPQTQIREVNAAISGTGSDFGAFRFGREVLEGEPDLIFVEFAVNDSGKPRATVQRSMEGIVRQAPPDTEFIFLYSIQEKDLASYRAGKLAPAAEAMEAVATHYNIPSVATGFAVAAAVDSGQLVFTGAAERTAENLPVFSNDGVHPYASTGHVLYADLVAELIRNGAGEGQRLTVAPLDPDHAGRATMVPVADLERTGDWIQLDDTVDPAAAAQAGRRDGDFWTALKPGAALKFRFRGTGFGLYGLKGPDAGQFEVFVDGKSVAVAALFDTTCVAGRFRIRPWIYPHALPDAEHAVEIRLLADPPDRANLLRAAGKDPAGLTDDVRLHISDVLINGVLLP